MNEGYRRLNAELRDERDQHILRLKSKGLTYEQISFQVGLKPRGVKEAVHRIRKRTE